MKEHTSPQREQLRVPFRGCAAGLTRSLVHSFALCACICEAHSLALRTGIGATRSATASEKAYQHAAPASACSAVAMWGSLVHSLALRAGNRGAGPHSLALRACIWERSNSFTRTFQVDRKPGVQSSSCRKEAFFPTTLILLVGKRLQNKKMRLSRALVDVQNRPFQRGTTHAFHDQGSPKNRQGGKDATEHKHFDIDVLREPDNTRFHSVRLWRIRNDSDRRSGVDRRISSFGAISTGPHPPAGSFASALRDKAVAVAGRNHACRQSRNSRRGEQHRP